MHKIYYHNLIVCMWLPGIKETVGIRILKALSDDLVFSPDFPHNAKVVLANQVHIPIS